MRVNAMIFCIATVIASPAVADVDTQVNLEAFSMKAPGSTCAVWLAPKEEWFATIAPKLIGTDQVDDESLYATIATKWECADNVTTDGSATFPNQSLTNSH